MVEFIMNEWHSKYSMKTNAYDLFNIHFYYCLHKHETDKFLYTSYIRLLFSLRYYEIVDIMSALNVLLRTKNFLLFLMR